MTQEEQVPWQKRYDFARRLLARALLRSPAPWPSASERDRCIRECLTRSGLRGKSVERHFRLYAECLLQGKEPFPGRRVLIV